MNVQATIYTIPAGRIHPCPQNPRKKVSEDELRELSESIGQVGMLQPITVRQDTTGFEIVCGHRRFEAAKLAGLEEIPCVVRVLTDEEAYEIMVTENLQRKDIDPFEEAKAFSLLRNRGYDADALSEKFGKSKTFIYTRLKLNELIPEFFQKYEEGTVDISHCYILSRLSPDFQKQLLPCYGDNSYNDLSGKSVRELKWAIQRKGRKLSDAKFDATACADCPKNTACASLFLDTEEATCEDVSCFVRKTVDFEMAKLEKAREVNSDFAILADSYVSDSDKPVLEEAKQRGFKIVKGFSWDYSEIKSDEPQDIAFIEKEKPAVYAIGDYGPRRFRGPKNAEDQKRAKPEPRKDDWSLDRIARNIDDRRAMFKGTLIEDDIVSLTDTQLSTMAIMGGDVLRAALLYVIPDTDPEVKAYGLEGGMDEDDARKRIIGMKDTDVVRALAKFLVPNVFSSESSNVLVSTIFPTQFERNRDADVEKCVIDECRKCWFNYDEVTDQMVLDDLSERIAKEKQNKEE